MFEPRMRGRERRGSKTMTMRRDAAFQTTLKGPVGCSGMGLHCGKTVSMTLSPAAPNTGIVFQRLDMGGAIVPATWRHVVDTRLCSMVGADNGARVGTVEHLMAAFAGCGIDNARIAIDGPEVPAMDGSAAPFVTMIERAGLTRQGARRRVIEVLKPVTVADKSAHASLAPADSFKVSFEIDFDNPTIQRQSATVTLMNGTFKSKISRARTFGFESEVEALRKAGLALGGSLENAIVIGRDGILNEEGLRYDDEFVRHKILDCIGDLYLAGAPIVGHFRGYRSGHAMNLRLLEALFADPTAWRYANAAARTKAVAAPALQLAAGD